MPIGISIEDFSVEELRQMVLNLQAIIQSEKLKREMDAIHIKALEMEVAVCRDLLGRQIVSLVVGPTMIPTGTLADKVREVETGEEEEAKPVTTDDSEKDKFQA